MEPWHLGVMRAERDRIERQLDGIYLPQLHHVRRLKLAYLNAYIAGIQAQENNHVQQEDDTHTL